MYIKATFTVISIVLISYTVSSPAEDDYYYDYEEYDDTPSKSDSYKDNEFNLEALVSAWRDYVKEKKGHSRRTSASGGGGNKASRPSRPKNNRRHHGDRYEEAGEHRREEEERLPPVVEEDEKESCVPREESYFTPDEEQCDKYYECNIKGEVKEKLCLDGLMFDVKQERCDYPAKVDCANRKKLQEAKPSENCPRQNGFFAWPSELSCQKFWDCREGKGYLQTCPEGVIFDPKIDACVTPDQSARKECTGGKFFGFQCPSYTPEQELRFGNHDRLPHPDNCQKFYSCLRDGSPRLAACPKNTVFNNGTGHCSDPTDVPGCEDFWAKKKEDEYDYYY